MSPWQSICHPFYLTHAPGAFTGAAVKNRLEAFHNQIQDPWYQVISACLLDRIKEKSLAEKAGEQPSYLVTGHAALWDYGRKGVIRQDKPFGTIQRPWGLIATTGSNTSLPKNGSSDCRKRPANDFNELQAQNFSESFRHKFRKLSINYQRYPDRAC